MPLGSPRRDREGPPNSLWTSEDLGGGLGPQCAEHNPVLVHEKLLSDVHEIVFKIKTNISYRCLHPAEGFRGLTGP